MLARAVEESRQSASATAPDAFAPPASGPVRGSSLATLPPRPPAAGPFAAPHCACSRPRRRSPIASLRRRRRPARPPATLIPSRHRPRPPAAQPTADPFAATCRTRRSAADPFSAPPSTPASAAGSVRGTHARRPSAVLGAAKTDDERVRRRLCPSPSTQPRPGLRPGSAAARSRGTPAPRRPTRSPAWPRRRRPRRRPTPPMPPWRRRRRPTTRRRRPRDDDAATVGDDARRPPSRRRGRRNTPARRRKPMAPPRQAR